MRILEPTNISAACYRKHEAIKKRAYEQRVREVEHSSFTPLVLCTTGGLATEATTFYKRLSACLADKWEQSYSTTLAWLCCRLTFSLLRSAIQCIRASARSSIIGHASKLRLLYWPGHSRNGHKLTVHTLIPFLSFYTYLYNASHV